MDQIIEPLAFLPLKSWTISSRGVFRMKTIESGWPVTKVIN